MSKQFKPSKEVTEAVYGLVSIDDKSIFPLDDNLDQSAKEDFTDYICLFQFRWEQTSHFEHSYFQRIYSLGWQDAYAQVFQERDYAEPGVAFRQMFLEPLLAAFWVKWGVVHKLHDHWTNNVKMSSSNLTYSKS